MDQCYHGSGQRVYAASHNVIHISASLHAEAGLFLQVCQQYGGTAAHKQLFQLQLLQTPCMLAHYCHHHIQDCHTDTMFSCCCPACVVS